VLDLSGLSSILSIDEESGIAHVEVGATVSKLEAALIREGLTLRQDPPLHPNATIGQSLPALGGALCGMEAVLPDGRALRIRPAPRRAVGPDLLALVTVAGPRVLVPCAVYLRVRRLGDEPWVAAFTTPALGPALHAIQAALRRGIRPFCIEVRAPARGPCDGRIEVNAPVQVRTASEAIFREELTRAGGERIDLLDWPERDDVAEYWLTFAELVPAHARARMAARLVRFDTIGAQIGFARTPARPPRVAPPSPAMEAALDRLKDLLDPRGLLR
jgi:alkyldihydroxyacetonephosphate synthase